MYQVVRLLVDYEWDETGNEGRPNGKYSPGIWLKTLKKPVKIRLHCKSQITILYLLLLYVTCIS
jgi:hypothetical protein